MIGTLGDIVFEVSTEKVRTFDDLKRHGSARWATHDVLGKKPVREFIGPGLEIISFSMQFAAALGVNPLEEIKKLRELRDKGEAVELILNGTPVSENLWVVEEISENWKRLDNNGNLLFAEVEVSLQEYPRDSDAVATSANSSAVASSDSGEEDVAE